MFKQREGERMGKRRMYEERTESLILPILERNQFELVDVEYVKERVKSAIEYYKNLKPIFKDDDYKFLKTWLEVIERLQKGMEEC